MSDRDEREDEPLVFPPHKMERGRLVPEARATAAEAKVAELRGGVAKLNEAEDVIHELKGRLSASEAEVERLRITRNQRTDERDAAREKLKQATVGEIVEERHRAEAEDDACAESVRADAAETDAARLREALREADGLLNRLHGWDVMSLPGGDGEVYWKGEITRVRARNRAALENGSEGEGE